MSTVKRFVFPVQSTATVSSPAARSIQSRCPVRIPSKSAPAAACSIPCGPAWIGWIAISEVGEHDRGEREQVPARDEQEEGGGDDAAEQDDVVEPRQPDLVLDVPERHDHQRVRAHLQLQEALVRDQRGQNAPPTHAATTA